MKESQNVTEDVTVESTVPWTELTFWTGTATIVAALFGVVGNMLCFMTAPSLPDSTTKYLMKYLAVWDSLRALQVFMLPSVFYRLLLHVTVRMQVKVPKNFHALIQVNLSETVRI